MPLRVLSILAVAAAVAAAACNGMPGRHSAASVEVRPDRVKDFALLYSENCQACHGSGGRGNGAAIGLADPVYLAIASDAVIRRVTAEGVPGTAMPAFSRAAGGALTDEQVGILTSGIRAWAGPDALGRAEPPPYAAGGGDPARGVEVYAAACASCHGPTGAGGERAGSIVDGSFLGLVSDQGLRTTVIAGRPDIGQPDWRGDVAGRVLTPQEVSDVVAWLSAQRPSTPGEPYPGGTDEE